MSGTYAVDELTYLPDSGLSFTCLECGDGRVDLHHARCFLCNTEYSIEVAVTKEAGVDE